LTWVTKVGAHEEIIPFNPGRITISGTAILKYDPMIGANFAARRSLAEMARWTTRKSVVQ